MTALGAAALGGHSAVARLLLEARVQIDPVDVAGETPLFYASRDGQDDVACLLLKAGAEADKETLGGQFPLLAACHGGHFDVVRHLLEAKSVVDRTGPDLKTPLMIASRCGYTQVVWLLLEKRASKSATDIFGESAYLAACRSQKQELIQLFTGTGIHDLSCRSEPLLQLAYIQITLHAIAFVPCMPCGVRAFQDAGRFKVLPSILQGHPGKRTSNVKTPYKALNPRPSSPIS